MTALDTSGVMLYAPDHALTIAAEAIGKHAESTDMAVGIVFGIRACITEYQRLLSSPSTQEIPADKGKAKPPDGARERVGALSRS